MRENTRWRDLATSGEVSFAFLNGASRSWAALKFLLDCCFGFGEGLGIGRGLEQWKNLYNLPCILNSEGFVPFQFDWDLKTLGSFVTCCFSEPTFATFATYVASADFSPSISSAISSLAFAKSALVRSVRSWFSLPLKCR